MDNDNYVAVIGTFEYFFEGASLLGSVASAIQASGLKQPRNGTEHVRVDVYKLSLNRGKVQRTRIRSFEARIPFEVMTKETYEKELEDAVKKFAQKVSRFCSSRSMGTKPLGRL